MANGSLLSEDFAAGQIPQGDRGPQGPPGPTHFARVQSDGDLAGGTATSAARTGPGRYRVVFGGPVAACAGVANSGLFNGADSGNFRTWAFVRVGFDAGVAAPNVVEVETFGSNAASVDTAFHLVLACPS